MKKPASKLTGKTYQAIILYQIYSKTTIKVVLLLRMRGIIHFFNSWGNYQIFIYTNT